MSKDTITIINYFPLLEHGFMEGRYRTFYLCKYLGKRFDVRLLSLDYSKNTTYKDFSKANNIQYSGNFKEVCYVKISKLYSLLTILNKFTFNFKKLRPIITEAIFYFNRGFRKLLKQSIQESDIIILEYPYLFLSLQKYRGTKFTIYDAHNVEYDYQNSILPNSTLKRLFLVYVKFMEYKSCHAFNIVLAVSEGDKERLHRLYRISLDKIHVIPHGIDIKELNLTSRVDRESAKHRYGLSFQGALLFVGGNHKPNLEAVEFIVFKMAAKLKKFNFLIVGDVGREFKKKYGNLTNSFKNVIFFGRISQEEKKEILKASDIALNPVLSGGGTNVKMLEYMAAGIPIVTTPFGARGIKVEHGKHAIICDLDNFEQNIEELYRDKNLYENFQRNARKLVEEKYDWEIIISGLLKILENNKKSKTK